MKQELRSLSHSELILRTSALVAEERRVSTEVLRHLREIESRRLFSEMGFGSMYEMLTRHFGYSEGSAHRRLSASRLLKEIPEIEPALKVGKLTLTTVSLAQNFFQAEKKSGTAYTSTAKQELLKSLEGKSRLETEKELANRAPHAARPERERVLNSNERELRITLTEAQLAKLKKLKMLLSHQNPNWTYAELIEHLADSELKRKDPEMKAPSPGEAKRNRSVKRADSRYVPASLRVAIWKRAGGKCEKAEALTGRRCESRFRLQIDHRIPLALGGRTVPENLRLLCRNCNIHAAFEALGPEVMNRYTRRN